LCNEALSCLRTSGCANVPEGLTNTEAVAACYCGSVPFADCQSANANGPCHTQFERALETSVKAELVDRISKASFGGGRAYNRAACDSFFCTASDGCFGKP